MKNKCTKNIFISLLACVCVCGLLMGLFKNKTTTKTKVASTKDAIMLGEQGITAMQHGFPGSFEKIYYGIDENGAMEWDVLNPKETNFLDENNNPANCILMLSNKVYGNLPFADTKALYQDSNLRKEILSFASSVLSDKEEMALVKTKQAGGKQVREASYKYNEPELVGDVFFAPTATIMSNEEYGVKDRHHRQKSNYYWMSSISAKNEAEAGYISKCGVFATLDKNVSSLSMRMATNVDHNAISFVSKAIGVKDVELGKFTKIEPNQTYYEYKVTIKDDTQRVVVDTVRYHDNKISFNYSAEGNGNYLSAIIVDEKKEHILYYGQLANISKNKKGTVEVEIPKEKNYHLFVFSEQYNGDKKTDYSSELMEIEINEG